jgi:hypothetical protein
MQHRTVHSNPRRKVRELGGHPFLDRLPATCFGPAGPDWPRAIGCAGETSAFPRRRGNREGTKQATVGCHERMARIGRDTMGPHEGAVRIARDALPVGHNRLAACRHNPAVRQPADAL